MAAAPKSRIESYRDLIVWQKGMDLAASIYECTARFPNFEQYGLSSQMRRAAVSVPANIAEGFGRATGRDYANFLSIARGSVLEVETMVLLSERLRYINEETCRGLVLSTQEVARMLYSLRRRVTARGEPISPAED